MNYYPHFWTGLVTISKYHMPLQAGIAFKACMGPRAQRSLGLKGFRWTIKKETRGILISDIQSTHAHLGASVPFSQQCTLLSANEMIPYFKNNCS